MSSAFWLVNSGVYGELTWIVPDVKRSSFAAVFVFELFMAVIALICLNLLIVIMNDATNKVRAASQRVAVSEKTQLLLEIDELWLPVMASMGRRRVADSANFPRWLHALAPAAVM